MHIKDFDNWNEKKKSIQDTNERPLYSERDVWWAHVGVNVGDEQDGKGLGGYRPVLIFRKFNKNFFMAIPLSSKGGKKKSKYRYEFEIHGEQQVVLLSQAKAMDSKRLVDRMFKMSRTDFAEVKKAFHNILFKK
jgi:mRNA interferase MazF